MFVIMKTTHSPIAISWVRPHAIFEGTLKEVTAECVKLNVRATTNTYTAVKVPVIKAGIEK